MNDSTRALHDKGELQDRDWSVGCEPEVLEGPQGRVPFLVTEECDNSSGTWSTVQPGWKSWGVLEMTALERLGQRTHALSSNLTLIDYRSFQPYFVKLFRTTTDFKQLA